MVKIVRVRQAGTGYGGTGNPKAIPGVMHTKDTAVGDKDAPAMLRAFATMRERAARQIKKTSIGSRGRL
jgi:hypothetical protein